MADLTPTDEQAAALTAFGTGDSFVIEAGAGTGKTSTLELLARSTPRRGQYIAFNKAIVLDATARFPASTACNTAHSLAFRAVGREFSHRLQSRRMSPTQLARELGIDPFVVRVGSQAKRLAPGFLAGLVMRAVTRFCQSADPEPTARHVPYAEGVDEKSDDGTRGFDNNRELADYLAPFVRDAWADLSRPDGRLPYRHEHYLKAYHLSGPRLDVDYVLLDEAQDANPVIAAIVAAQDHAQRVYVGDSQQQIYSFTGAVNAMARMDGERVFLTRSFRFGPAVAEVANLVLGRLGAPLQIVGTESIPSTVGPIDQPDAVLCRTNATAVREVFGAMAAGKRVHMVGGGTDIISFCRGALSLQRDGWSGHPDLACFGSWGEVRDYVANDPQGDELALLVGLVEEFGGERIIAELSGMPREDMADLVVSTAHKAKGREWARVRLAPDLMLADGADTSPEELRLLYVAVTRARLGLDATAVLPGLGGTEPVEPTHA